MTNKEMWNAPDIVPTITYSDLPRAVEWFQRVFGFRERAEARLTWPGGGMTWIEVGNGLFNVSTLMSPLQMRLGSKAPVPWPRAL